MTSETEYSKTTDRINQKFVQRLNDYCLQYILTAPEINLYHFLLLKYSARKLTLKLYPGKADLFEMIYGSRFNRAAIIRRLFEKIIN